MTSEPDNTGKKKQSGQFRAGISGNPSGRPAGTRNKATLAMQALLDGEAEALTRKAMEMGLGGDVVALRLCFDRLLPPRRDVLVSIALPPIATAQDTVVAMSAILDAVANGDLTPTEGEALATLVEGIRKTIETALLEKKLRVLSNLLEIRGGGHA